MGAIVLPAQVSMFYNDSSFPNCLMFVTLRLLVAYSHRTILFIPQQTACKPSLSACFEPIFFLAASIKAASQSRLSSRLDSFNCET